MVGFRLKSAGEFHEAQRHDKAGGRARGIAGAAAHKDQRQVRDVGPLAAGLLARPVARAHVRDLVRHHASHFRFVIGGEDQAGIYVEESAGKGEGVDGIIVNNFDSERHLGVGVAHQVLADAVHVLGDYRILHQLHACLNLLGILLADGDLFLYRIPIAQAAAADVAIADGVNVVLFAIVLVLAI